MANKLYPKAREKFLSALLNIPADTIKVILLSDAYTYSDSHEFLSDVSAARLGTDQTLASKTITNGAVDGADSVFAALVAGSNAKFAALYKDTGVAGTSSLIYYMDTVTGLPMATNGGDITLQWDNGSYKIFALFQ